MKNTMRPPFLNSACLVFLAILCVACNSAEKIETEAGAQGTSPAVSAKGETTIRNVTKETVTYTVEMIGSPDSPEERTLNVGAIDRFQGTYDLDVTFFREGEPTTYRLEAGMPFSFRYDENDILELYEGSHGREDAEDLAPFLPTPMTVVDRMLEMAEVDSTTVLYDLGCGDGRIVIQAAKKYGARGIGVDIDPVRIEESNQNAKEAGVEDLVQFILGDVMKVDFSKATVVTLYLLPESNELLRPLFEKQLKKGAYVISHNYHVPGWASKEISFETIVAEDGDEHDIYLYRK